MVERKEAKWAKASLCDQIKREKWKHQIEVNGLMSVSTLLTSSVYFTLFVRMIKQDERDQVRSRERERERERFEP